MTEEPDPMYRLDFRRMTVERVEDPARELDDALRDLLAALEDLVGQPLPEPLRGLEPAMEKLRENIRAALDESL